MDLYSGVTIYSYLDTRVMILCEHALNKCRAYIWGIDPVLRADIERPFVAVLVVIVIGSRYQPYTHIGGQD